MSPPLPYGTLLQTRYRLKNLLAEGGFARTYLAEDTGRFEEACLLKEFCPSQNQPEFFAKAQELFQREAQTLYQLSHPQVPKFRALFTELLEGQQRLFLVQDYVEGDTFRVLLQRRIQDGKVFTEREIRQFLSQLLPILTYIHQQGIIHRDLSLDNLMQRHSDQKPVLIDFGVVKTVVTQLQQSQLLPVGTVVGTMGFAPFEQLQSGQAYPSSDLYALAVCCLVLLSGKEPVQLFDNTSLSWNWQLYTQLSPGFAQILNQMLAHRPSDRYGSAQEVLAALQDLPEVSSASALPAADLQDGIARQPIPDPSHPSDKNPPQTTQQRTPQRRSPQASRLPAGNQPLARQQRPSRFLPLIIFMSLLAAGGGWLATQLFLQNRLLQKEPRPSPSAGSSSPGFSPSVSPKLSYSETLQLSPGQSMTIRGESQPNEMQTYQFSASKGDRFSIQSNSKVKIVLLTSNLSPLEIASQSPNTWSTILPKTDTYTLRIINGSKTPQSYQVLLSLAPTEATEASASPQPAPTELTETAPPSPTLQTQTLTLDAVPQAWTGILSPGSIQRYIIPVSSGQVLAANVLENSPVTLVVRDPSGQPLPNGQNVLNWESLITEAGNYQVDVMPIETTTSSQFAVDLGTRQP
jgi:serine/threonine protein kinase